MGDIELTIPVSLIYYRNGGRFTGKTLTIDHQPEDALPLETILGTQSVLRTHAKAIWTQTGPTGLITIMCICSRRFFPIIAGLVVAVMKRDCVAPAKPSQIISYVPCW